MATVAAATAVALALTALPIAGEAAKPKPTPKLKLNAGLKGKHTVPGPGDPDGSGALKLTITKKKRKQRLCYELDVQGLGGVREARIREGAKGETGPSLQRLFKVSDPVTGEGTTKGCFKVKPTVVRELKRNARGLYAEIENAGYPQGALRGQLRKLG